MILANLDKLKAKIDELMQQHSAMIERERNIHTNRVTLFTKLKALAGQMIQDLDQILSQ